MSVDEQGRWRWSYSKWIGVMYGPVPVGVLLVVIVVGVYYGTR